MLRQTLSGPASFLAHRVLRLPQHGPLPRYTKLCTVFLLSGLLHEYVGVTCGISWFTSGSLQFFLTQATGIMFEDLVQEICRYAVLVLHLKPEKYASTNTVVRVVGRLWTALFLVWSGAVSTYPTIRKQTGDPMEAILRFSVLGACTEVFQKMQRSAGRA